MVHCDRGSRLDWIRNYDFCIDSLIARIRRLMLETSVSRRIG